MDMKKENRQKRAAETKVFRPADGQTTLTIPIKKYRGDSMVVSTRLTGELVAKLDEIAEQTGRTRNEIIQTCLEFAVDNLEIK